MRQDGDFQDFYQANYGRILAMTAAVLGDRQEAEDAAQEAFARALTRWAQLGGSALPEAWARKVALRIAIDSARRLRRVVRTSARTADPAERSSPAEQAGRRPGPQRRRHRARGGQRAERCCHGSAATT